MDGKTESVWSQGLQSYVSDSAGLNALIIFSPPGGPPNENSAPDTENRLKVNDGSSSLFAECLANE